MALAIFEINWIANRGKLEAPFLICGQTFMEIGLFVFYVFWLFDSKLLPITSQFHKHILIVLFGFKQVMYPLNNIVVSLDKAWNVCIHRE